MIIFIANNVLNITLTNTTKWQILSPGFPNTANVSCDWFLAVEPGKKVQMEIVLLEANSCCDSLILYDGYIGAPVIEKYDILIFFPSIFINTEMK
ncbi:hypothetical protein PRIPAC_80856 [Pristionchus pacificus]|uniref:Uncharacterized protein n=1 Tax=Pristionchus pacificus TaxID=54126 RepID=A0A2A6CNU8_PRIPA|nr:hypothetical protein PRIPAC_80856 [Pristionchus pacificus]|eukprot:PDM79701.1 hypothetical protein PRIPAC_32280 [Pristionchus pacificus]